MKALVEQESFLMARYFEKVKGGERRIAFDVLCAPQN